MVIGVIDPTFTTTIRFAQLLLAIDLLALRGDLADCSTGNAW